MIHSRRHLAFLCVAILSLALGTQTFARTKKHPPSKPIDLNTAALSQLEELPGVGPVTAKAILDFRAKSGPFKRVEDLLSVHRISEKRLNKLRPYVTVGPASHTATKQPPKQSQ